MMFESVIQAHLARYPAMQIQDMYKLIHQAAMGSEHAVASTDGPRSWMERELAEMGTGPDEPMTDPISADGQILRVHLRPFVAQGGDPEMLLTAFIRTANEFRGDTKILRRYWKVAIELGHFPSDQLDAFMQSMQAKKYPAAHHSPEFERLYRPAYRVVWRKFLHE
jgi:hypothetical protein